MKRLMIAAAMLLGMAFTAAADSAEAIRTRMSRRLPVARQLKQSGILGEDAAGYLAVVPGAKADPAAKELAAKENADRKLVYTAIGKKTGTSAENVGKQRALKNFERAKAGEYIQKDGKWQKK